MDEIIVLGGNGDTSNDVKMVERFQPNENMTPAYQSQ